MKIKTEKALGFFEAYNIIVTYPMFSSLAGFGMFWVLKLLGGNVFTSIFFGMYASTVINWTLTSMVNRDEI